MAPKFDIRHDERVVVIKGNDKVPEGSVGYVWAMKVSEGKAEYLLSKNKSKSRRTILGVVFRENIERVGE